MRIFLAALMVVGVTQQRAEACSCNANPDFPPATGVPLNAQLHVLLRRGASSFELRTENGVVATRTEQIPNGVKLIPSEPLTADTNYVLVAPDTQEQSSFQTGSFVDDVAPAAPTLGTPVHFVSPAIFRSTCDTGGETFSVPVPSVSGVYEVFIGPTVSTIDTTTPALTLSGSFGVILVGDGSLCDSNFPVSTTADLAIAVREVDLAGNVSPLSEPIQLKGGATGCTATDGPTLMILAGLLTRIWAKSRRKQAVG
jgi:hypothetical protein